MLCIPVTNAGVCLISSSLCSRDFSILRRLSLIVGRLSDEPAHIGNVAAQIRHRLRNGLAGVLCVPVADNCGVRVCFGSIRGGFVFKAGRALADSLVRVVGLPVTDNGIGLICCSLCGVNFGFVCKIGQVDIGCGGSLSFGVSQHNAVPVGFSGLKN